MFLPRNCFVGHLGKSIGLRFPLCKQRPYFCHLMGHHLTQSWGRKNIINHLFVVENSILGLIVHPKVKLCEILIFYTFGFIHCISNDFLNQLDFLDKSWEIYHNVPIQNQQGFDASRIFQLPLTFFVRWAKYGRHAKPQCPTWGTRPPTL